MTRTISPARIYDDFTGPALDPARWFILEYPPGPDGTAWRCEEPDARTSLADGTFEIIVERFRLAHDQVAIMDNPKYLALSTETFPLPAGGPLTFSTDIAVSGINAAARDYRDGFASLNVLNLNSGWVFDACATGDMLFAIHERLPMPGVEKPFTHVIDAPLATPPTEHGQSHRHSVALDASTGTARWSVDGTIVYEVTGAEIPTQVTIGLGLFTLHPIVNGRSTSCRGQGLSASFGPISIAGLG